MDGGLGATLRGLLAVPGDAELLRDHESPRDEPIEDSDNLEFADGPVFITSDPGLSPKAPVAATEVKRLMLDHVFGGR